MCYFKIYLTKIVCCLFLFFGAYDHFIDVKCFDMPSLPYAGSVFRSSRLKTQNTRPEITRTVTASLGPVTLGQRSTAINSERIRT